jgi:hypothetical protein
LDMLPSLFVSPKKKKRSKDGRYGGCWETLYSYYYTLSTILSSSLDSFIRFPEHRRHIITTDNLFSLVRTEEFIVWRCWMFLLSVRLRYINRAKSWMYNQNRFLNITILALWASSWQTLVGRR